MASQPKEKPCKGTGQASGFGCGKYTLHRVHGLGKMCCYPKWLFQSDAGKAKLAKAINKVQKPRLELEKAIIEKKSKSDLKRALENTRKEVHEYIRQRDKGKPCICCNTPWRDDFHACHYYKAELYETLKFNLLNIHGGCPKCNLYKDGNIEKYCENLPLRIGTQNFIALQELAQVDKQFSKVWNIENLKEIRNQIKTLKSQL